MENEAEIFSRMRPIDHAADNFTDACYDTPRLSGNRLVKSLILKNFEVTRVYRDVSHLLTPMFQNYIHNVESHWETELKEPSRRDHIRDSAEIDDRRRRWFSVRQLSKLFSNRLQPDVSLFPFDTSTFGNLEKTLWMGMQFTNMDVQGYETEQDGPGFYIAYSWAEAGLDVGPLGIALDAGASRLKKELAAL